MQTTPWLGGAVKSVRCGAVRLVVLTHLRCPAGGAVFLCSGLQSVRELEQSLLIVYDVQVVDTGFHLWTAVLGTLIAYRGRKDQNEPSRV